MHWSKNPQIRAQVIAKMSAKLKGRISPRKGVTLSEDTRHKIGVAQKQRYESGEMFGFQKGHPRFTKNIHRFTKEESAGGIPKRAEAQRGIKRPNQTGINHHNWKGGYQNRLWLAKRRDAMKKGATGRHTRQQWNEIKAIFDYQCASCGRYEPEIRLTEDHIIPLSKGGNDSIENIQPLCRSCNTKKFTKTTEFAPVALAA
jgi:5-methylcytosine-specific restriction endonuclease McrA